MTNYHQYHAVDFAADDFFKNWICDPDPHSDAFWKAFLKEYPEKYYELEEAKILISNLNKIERDIATNGRIERLWSRVDASSRDIQPIFAKRLFPFRKLGLAAASIVLALIAYSFWLKKPDTGVIPASAHFAASSEWEEISNTSAKPLLVRLPDQSEVILNKNSSVRYPARFDAKKREVLLIGEAFFDVSKNPEKPFLVYSNGLVTKVLGTSFTIRSVANEPDVTVSVKTGLVSVYSERRNKDSDPEAEGIVLTPNQKAVFQKDKALLSRTLVEKPEVVVPEAALPSFIFENAPAAEVFETLEKVYGVDVIFDEQVMKNCTLTMDLSKADLFEKLVVICKVLDTEYKLIDAQVIIYGKSC
ncbi:FecR family protein [Dyadobacter sp. CY323]|uniref:FecR family protein n=1 Tax=Dyadobacter sp. CY323 TaxID=2907302 RepID=UPI001F28256E|nr:FecR family protein [Dyadobacter sp. CY323]MCE6991253.1 FecR domain-containing protein [Dyadobacter sp. CY323]